MKKQNKIRKKSISNVKGTKDCKEIEHRYHIHQRSKYSLMIKNPKDSLHLRTPGIYSTPSVNTLAKQKG